MDDALIGDVVALARTLPGAIVHRFAVSLHGADGLRSVPGDGGRRFEALLVAWTQRGGSRESLASALIAAARTAEAERQAEQIDLVWTGPHGERFGLLRIGQSLLDLIDQAKRSLLLVTFAAYEVEDVRAALVRAADRGVHVRVVAEHARERGGGIAFDPLPALLPSELLERVDAYYWPAETRPTEGTKKGTLHAKSAVRDDEELLVSSANFTGHAMSINMELGVRVRGGELPRKVREHFDELVRSRVLRAV